jgi:uncharacterized membrane protein YkvA (DUF1232 family)
MMAAEAAKGGIAMKETLRARAEQLKTDLPAVLLCLRDRETPVRAKLCAALAAVYALSPVDLIPDFIPVLGYLDDLVILPALIALTVRLIPPAVWARCRAEAAAGRAGGRKRWFYALPFVLLWLLLAWLIVRAVWL